MFSVITEDERKLTKTVTTCLFDRKSVRAVHGHEPIERIREADRTQRTTPRTSRSQTTTAPCKGYKVPAIICLLSLALTANL